jgi:hypothetical protein
MNTSALLMMIVTQSLVTGFTIYFFYKVLTNKRDTNTGVKDA